jgi:hypothetical protein
VSLSELAALLEYFEYKPDGNLKSLLDVSIRQPKLSASSVDAPDDELDMTSSSEPQDKVAKAPVVLTPHFKPNLTIQPVNVFDAFQGGRLPPQMVDEIVVSEEVSAYYPVVQISDFWLLRVRFSNLTFPLLL